jgi:hypothetical protein
MRDRIVGRRDNRKLQLAEAKRKADIAHSLRELEILFSKPKKKITTLLKNGGAT